MYNNPDSTQMLHFMAIIFGFYAVIILIALAAMIIPSWFICKKAGFSPWLAFLHLIPLGGLVLLYVLAFADWKVIPAPQPYWGQYPPQPPYPPAPPAPPQA